MYLSPENLHEPEGEFMIKRKPSEHFNIGSFFFRVDHVLFSNPYADCIMKLVALARVVINAQVSRPPRVTLRGTLLIALVQLVT